MTLLHRRFQTKCQRLLEFWTTPATATVGEQRPSTRVKYFCCTVLARIIHALSALRPLWELSFASLVIWSSRYVQYACGQVPRLTR